MLTRFMTGAFILAVVLAVTAAVFEMVNLGHIDWKPAAKALGLTSIMFGAWSLVRAKEARRASQGGGPAQQQRRP